MYKLVYYMYLLSFAITVVTGILTLKLLMEPSFNLLLTTKMLSATLVTGLFTKFLGDFK